MWWEKPGKSTVAQARDGSVKKNVCGGGRGDSSCANAAERLSKKRIEPHFLDSANWRLLVLC